jgi:hypothetical protein
MRSTRFTEYLCKGARVHELMLNERPPALCLMATFGQKIPNHIIHLQRGSKTGFDIHAIKDSRKGGEKRIDEKGNETTASGQIF